MVKNIQLVVKFQNDGSIYTTFESIRSQKVNWDNISDEEYEKLLKCAILTIEEWREQYVISKHLDVMENGNTTSTFVRRLPKTENHKTDFTAGKRYYKTYPC